MIQIQAARFPDQLDVVRAIFSEYAATLQVDLSFQGFAGELASLPGKYAEPAGCVLLAVFDGAVIGCVALRPLDGRMAEMKRLYVRPAGRGKQVGRELAERICELARRAGYRWVRLDTMPPMKAAQGLYETLGFKPIDAYVYNPVEGTQFMELDLEA